MNSKRAKNLVIALSLATAAVLLAYRRLLPLVVDFAHYSDGARTWASTRDAAVRHVVWDSPRALNEALHGDLDSPGHESHVARSRDGRWLAFAAGERGDRELFLAEVVGERVLEAQPLTVLNSAADECAPAFADGRLYFASDCQGGVGGFDLYVADWNDGEVGEPRAVDGLNTTADELDPAARGDELAFASNREHAGRTDFDLFSMRGGDVATLASIAALNSQGDEREPSFAAENGALYFASDRAGESGFDLYRAFEDGGAWLAPEALDELNTPGSERAPSPSHDGLTLMFARASESAEAPELWLARSREIYRVPEGPRGWYDLALAAALVALALLAWLAKRWVQLDVLYKCVLASVLIHLLLMVWFRYIHPEGGAVDLPERSGETFRVRLAPSDREQRALRLRDGELELSRADRTVSEQPERADIELAQPQVEPAASGSLAAAASELAPAPERAPDPIDRSPSIAPAEATDVQQPREQFERREVASSELALEARSERAPARGDAGQLERARLSRETTQPSVAAPSAGVIVAKRADATADDAPTRFVPAEIGPIARGEREHATPELAGPSEPTTARLADAASGPNVQAQQFETRRTGERDVSASPARAAVARAARSSPAEATPSASPGALAVERAGEHELEVRGFSPSAGAPASRGAPSTPELAAPRESFARGMVAEAPADHLPTPVATGARREGSSAPLGPLAQLERSAAAPRLEAAAEAPEIPSSTAPLIAAPRERELDLPQAPARLDQTPYRSRFGPQKEIALREHGGTAETERAVALGLRYLASRQRDEGAWGSEDDRSDKYRDVRVGKTALALLAFLGAGHTPISDTEHAGVAERAVRFLLAAQDQSTGHFGDSEAYSHGTSTYALAECFALTRDARLREPLERAIRQILRHQLARGDARRVGGWSYYYPDGATFDSWPRTSITSWQVMALESARLGGLSVPDATFEAAHEFLLNAWDGPLGAFRYNHDPQRLASGYPTLPGSTPAALFALALLGEEIDAPRWRAAVDFVTARAPRSFRFVGDDEFVSQAQGNLYFWYYGSLALLRHGGDEWERWNAALKTTLLPSQRRDGSWEPIDIYCRYAGDDDGDAVYATAMCTLTLEVYYRYFTPLLRVR